MADEIWEGNIKTTTDYQYEMETTTVEAIGFESQFPNITTVAPNFENCPLSSFGLWFDDAKQWIALSICVCGIVTNILNMIVFSYPSMKKSPTNIILRALAFTDFLHVLRLFLSYTVLNSLNGSKQCGRGTMPHFKTRGFAYLGGLDYLAFANFHKWSVYLTLLVGVWRLIGVVSPLKSLHWLTARKAHWAIWWSIFSSTLIGLPLFIGPSIVYDLELDFNKTGTGKEGECIGFPFTVHADDVYIGVQLVLTILFVKLGPCFLLSFITVRLIMSLDAAKKQRADMNELTSSSPTTTPNSSQTSSSPPTTTPTATKENEPKSRPNSMKINEMLIVVLLIFIVTEFPTGILFILIIFLDGSSRDCALILKEPFAVSEFVSSATSFFVYLAMSGNFRTAFFKMIGRTK